MDVTTMLMSGGVTREHDVILIWHARRTKIALVRRTTKVQSLTLPVDRRPTGLGVAALMPNVEHRQPAIPKGDDGLLRIVDSSGHHGAPP
jgi:hypothetical protein